MLCPRTACKREIPDDSVFCCYCGKKIGPVQSGERTRRGNKTGSIYKRGNTYMVDLRVYQKSDVVARKQKGGFKSKKEAAAYIERYLGGGIEQKTMTISEAWELLKQTKKFQSLSKNKQSQYKTAYKRIEKLYFRNIGGIAFSELQAVVDAAPGDYYPHRDVKILLGKLYDVAVTNEALDIGQDKTALIELPPQPESERDAFTADEVKKMWEAYNKGDKMAAFALILCYTGMRPGELLQVELENVDLKTQKIIGGIKSAAGINREIPIATAIVPVVEKVMQTATHGLADSCREHFYDDWKSESWGIRPHMTAHSGRHTLATAMEKAGVSVMVRKKILGHKIDDVTERYTHIDFATKLAAVELATKNFK